MYFSSIYAVKQGGNSLSRKPQNPEASRNTSELEESVEATTSSQNRPVRSKNRPAPPPDLSVLMETSGITEEGPMQFDDVISTSPALDTGSLVSLNLNQS